MRPDQHYFFTADACAFCAYRVEAGCLVVSGDPVGAQESYARLWGELQKFARTHGLRLAVVNASGDFAAVCEAAGLRSLYMGDEAMVGTEFSLQGRSVRKVRQSVNRVAREGYSAQLVRLGALSPAELSALERVASHARGGRHIDGFSSAMEGFRGEHQSDSVMLLCRDNGGAIGGFLHFVPCYGRPAVSLSAMCRAPGTPNGLTEFMVVSSLGLLRAGEIEEVSLNYAALSRYIHSPRHAHERIIGRLARLLDPFFQIDSLYRFNAKFFPRWQPRFLVCESRLGMPRAALAIVHAEGLLPRWKMPLGRARPQVAAPKPAGL